MQLFYRTVIVKQVRKVIFRKAESAANELRLLFFNDKYLRR
jgi:hypothetical protein